VATEARQAIEAAGLAGTATGGGAIRFGADGSMFLTTGDAAHFDTVNDNALRAQSTSSLVGKMLRITTGGAGLPTNPFWNGDAAASRSKVWA